MYSARISRIWGVTILLITIFSSSFLTYAQYSGGSGELNSPYQIATAEDLILLGESTEDYDKHFVLTADIDLDPNLPGRKVFDTAVIAPDTNDTKYWFQGTAFTGVFDGNDHTISHLTIEGGGLLGLFGQTRSGARISNLGVEAVDVNGTGDFVGGLVGCNEDGNIATSYSTGSVTGNGAVGGLVGRNESFFGIGSISNSYSTSTVVGVHPDGERVGGLVGQNSYGSITTSYSTGAVIGVDMIGGLVGRNRSGTITRCYSAGNVAGEGDVGGLVGNNATDWGPSTIIDCYSLGSVTGTDTVGGLVGSNHGGCTIATSYSTGYVLGNENVGGLVGANKFHGGGVVQDNCFWDIETSSQTFSDGGTGLTTEEMRDPNTYMAKGWDFVAKPDGPHDIWVDPEGGGYPILWWQADPDFGLPTFSGGTGKPNDPYIISTPEELNSIADNPRLMPCHFRMINDVDLTDTLLYPIGSYLIDLIDYPMFSYQGVFDGNGYTISHLEIEGDDDVYAGLFSILGDGAEVKNLGVVEVNISSSSWRPSGGVVGYNLGGTLTNCHTTGTVHGSSQTGGLVGYNSGDVIRCYSEASITGSSHVGGIVGDNNGNISNCYSTGAVAGTYYIGGLVGLNTGDVLNCCSAGTVEGFVDVGGLVGLNSFEFETRSDGGIASKGRISSSFSTGDVSGDHPVGGLVGKNRADVINCYSSGTVNGNESVGGLVGCNDFGLDANGTITTSYCTGMVTGNVRAGGLVGDSWQDAITSSFWDTESSGQATSAGGIGVTTTEMQSASPFLEAGWDFIDETENGTDDIWCILEGQDYPRLWWERVPWDGQTVGQ